MILRSVIFIFVFFMHISCNPIPGMQLSVITVEVLDSCEVDTEEHTVRIWAIQEPEIEILVLADSIILDRNASRELTFLSLEKTYFQLVGTNECRSTWEQVDIGKETKQTFSYTRGVSYLSINISSLVGDERDSLQVNVTRIIKDVINIELPGDESNHTITNISFADLPLDSLELTTEGHYQIEVINFVNRVPRLVGQQSIHANVPTLTLDF